MFCFRALAVGTSGMNAGSVTIFMFFFLLHRFVAVVESLVFCAVHQKCSILLESMCLSALNAP